MIKQVGFSIRIRVEWLEQTAMLYLAGKTRDEIKLVLEENLADKLAGSGQANRGSRQKAISILLKTWVTVPKEMKPLRDEGLELMKNLPSNEHLVLHWGMTMAAYPFFGTVAEITGRLLRLQGYVSTTQVLRRTRELMGERETVARATRRVLRCFADWGVLEDTEENGICRPASTLALEDTKLATWLIEAALISSGSNSKALKAIADTPALFPFVVGSLNTIELEKNSRLELFRHGLDEDIVSLRQVAV